MNFIAKILYTVVMINIVFISSGKSLPFENSSIANSLGILSKTCVNKFLVSQIIEKIDECKVSVPPYKGKQIDCLLFYDINKQLCQAAKDSNLVVSEEQISKLEEVYQIDTLCKSAATWNVSNLEEYSHYKAAVDKAFKTPFSCALACAEDDVEAVDVKFFCKYYSWGLNLLKNKDNIPKQEAEDTAAEVLEPEQIINNKKPETTAAVSTSGNTANQANPSNPANEIKPPISDKTEAATKNSNVTPVKDPITQIPSKDNLSSNKDIKVEKEQKTVPIVPVLSETANNDPGNDVAEKPLMDDEKPPEKDFDEKEAPVGEKAQGAIGDDLKSRASYDDDDVEYEKVDMEGFESDKVNPKKPQVKQTVDVSLAREMITSTFPEGTENNDNFFPFFMTGILIVIILYILYHNKNCVSNLVLGLIVEGRQSNRRRNSRAHAYRRLDTLEQAMNTNSSASPSKIIY